MRATPFVALTFMTVGSGSEGPRGKPEARKCNPEAALLCEDLRIGKGSRAVFNKVVVANRGAVAARVLRALDEMGIASVAVYSEADAGAPYLALASETYAIGPAPARESYLNQDALLDVLKKSGADGLHPGLRLPLRERGVRAARDRRRRALHRAVAEVDRRDGPQDAGARARGAATACRCRAAPDVLPAEPEAILAAARAIGFPVLVKPAGGGGGIGMLPAKDEVAAARRRRALALDGERAASATPRSISSA